jgi:hypothetical protein
MATKHLFLSDLHFNHKLWQNELSFFQQEIGLYEGYLAEVAQRWSDKEVKRELEHFQNQFIIQKEQAEILVHDIKLAQQAAANFAKENEVAIDHKHFDDKAGTLATMAERVDTYKDIYSELKGDFKKFLAKYL